VIAGSLPWPREERTYLPASPSESLGAAVGHEFRVASVPRAHVDRGGPVTALLHALSAGGWWCHYAPRHLQGGLASRWTCNNRGPCDRTRRQERDLPSGLPGATGHPGPAQRPQFHEVAHDQTTCPCPRPACRGRGLHQPGSSRNDGPGGQQSGGELVAKRRGQPVGQRCGQSVGQRYGQSVGGGFLRLAKSPKVPLGLSRRPRGAAELSGAC
jgi:hypothetical protein